MLSHTDSSMTKGLCLLFNPFWFINVKSSHLISSRNIDHMLISFVKANFNKLNDFWLFADIVGKCLM